MTVDVMISTTVLSHLHGATAMHDDGEAPGGGVVIEWAPFRLRDGATEAALLVASDAIQREFLGRQPGFVRRELARGAGGLWADVVHWADGAAAEAAMATAATSPVCRTYFELMAGAQGGADPAEGLLHLERVRAYSRAATP
jgi:hypothetical protein